MGRLQCPDSNSAGDIPQRSDRSDLVRDPSGSGTLKYFSSPVHISFFLPRARPFRSYIKSIAIFHVNNELSPLNRTWKMKRISRDPMKWISREHTVAKCISIEHEYFDHHCYTGPTGIPILRKVDDCAIFSTTSPRVHPFVRYSVLCSISIGYCSCTRVYRRKPKL